MTGKMENNKYLPSQCETTGYKQIPGPNKQTLAGDMLMRFGVG